MIAKHTEEVTETSLVLELALSLFDLPHESMTEEDTMQCGLSALEVLTVYKRKLDTGEAVSFTAETNALLGRVYRDEFSPVIQ